MPRHRVHLNPPLPSEGPRENVANASAMLHSIDEEPQLFSREDMQQTIKAAIVRLDRALKQLTEMLAELSRLAAENHRLKRG